MSDFEGMVVRAHGGFYYIETPAGLLTCRLRGTLKQETWESDIIAVGDRVRVLQQADGSARVVSGSIAVQNPGYRGEIGYMGIP